MLVANIFVDNSKTQKVLMVYNVQMDQQKLALSFIIITINISE